jgi:hypothetical protein
LLAVIVGVAAFRRGKVNRPLLIVFNIIGLLLLANIVSIAALSLPSPMQQLNFESPNRGVLLFPYNHRCPHRSVLTPGGVVAVASLRSKVELRAVPPCRFDSYLKWSILRANALRSVSVFSASHGSPA